MDWETSPDDSAPTDEREQTARFMEQARTVIFYHVPSQVRSRIERCWLHPTLPHVTLSRLREIDNLHPITQRGLILLYAGKAPSDRSLRIVLSKLRESYPVTPICLVYEALRESFALELMECGMIDGFLNINESHLRAHAVLSNLLLRAGTQRQLLETVQELERQSVRDGLTGLYHHAYMLELLEREFSRAVRNGAPLSCVMLDLDRFKAINDSYGHRYGDYVLRQVSQILKSNLRVSDTVGRYGGEEFLLLLPETDEQEALRVAEKLRTTIESATFRSAGVQSLVTASFGVASNQHAQAWEDLLVLADRMLYYAKENGRNCVWGTSEHTGISEFDTFRRQLRLKTDSSPVVLLLSRDPSVQERFVRVANSEQYQLVTFEGASEFFANCEAFAPECAVIDTATEEVTESWLTQFTTRSRQTQIPVILLVTEDKILSPSPTLQSTEFILLRNTPELVFRKYLTNVLALRTLRAEVSRLSRDIQITQKRIIRHERMRTVGELAIGLTQQLTNLLASISMHCEQLALKPEKATTVISELTSRGLELIRQVQLQVAAGAEEEIATWSLSDLISQALRLVQSWGIDDLQTWDRRYRFHNSIPESLPVVANRNKVVIEIATLIMRQVESLPHGGILRFSSEEGPQAVNLVIEAIPADYNQLDERPLNGEMGSESKGKSLSLPQFVKSLAFAKVAVPDDEPTLRLRKNMVARNDVSTGEPEGLKKKRILVIDEDPTCRTLTTQLFRQLGHEVWEIETMANDAAKLPKVEWDFVFAEVNVQSPAQWVSFCEFLKKASCPRVYLLTSFPVTTTRVLQSASIAGVISKPLSAQKAREIVGELRPVQ